jgi:hypothetical protein
VHDDLALTSSRIPTGVRKTALASSVRLLCFQNLVGLAVDAVEFVLRKVALVALFARKSFGADGMATVWYRIVSEFPVLDPGHEARGLRR